MEVELCTGRQETEEELEAFLMAHPDFREDNPLALNINNNERENDG